MNSANSAGRSLFFHPYVYLLLTYLAWAGHTTAGRMTVGEASPMAVTSLRWIVAFSLMAIFVRKEVAGVPALFRERPFYLVAMGVSGFTAFNALYYVAAQHTTAINLGIMQASTPLVMIAGAILFQGARTSPPLLLGLAAGTIGVLTVVSGGRLETLTNISFNRGDVLVLIASVIFAGYSLAIRNRPTHVSGITLFAAFAAVAAVTALPLVAFEIATGAFKAPTLKGWLLIAWIGIFPSLLAQIWYLKGVAAVGATRAGYLYNLIPIFSALIAVVVLGETFGWHHAVGIALVIGGIALAERYRTA